MGCNLVCASLEVTVPCHLCAKCPAGAHMVPTCTGEFKQRMVTFLDSFRHPGSVSVGSSLTSLDDAEAANTVEEVTAAVGRL